MTQTEVRTFFNVIAKLRDQALFSLVYHHGLRVSEVALVERSDIDLERKRVVIKRVKNGVWTERPLFASTEAILREYLTAKPDNGSMAVFPGAERRR
jgi:type 1 fimbriae regulatory protein FimB